MKNMRILFLHGLESKPGCEKVQYLESLGHTVHGPSLDYHDDMAYENLCTLTSHDNYDVIIGSSMGGWFAWNLGKELGVPVLLLNPALHSRSVEHIIGSWSGEFYAKSKVLLALGSLDDIIDGDMTIEWLNENDPVDWNHDLIKGLYGHRTPVDIFVTIFKHFEEDILKIKA
tara:strand:- start:142 stop:657 length:516 start_codon:yes stop_codon:yes gene_type:complete